WKRFTDFLISKMQEFGAADLEYVEVPYDHYIVDDWPDRRTHMHDSGIAVEKLITDGKPVPVVASYGMTSGFTPPNGITAPMLYYDAAHPPAAADIAGKILVFQTAPYPDPPFLELISRQLHADRLRVAFAGQMGAAVYTASGQRYELVSLPLGLESSGRIRRDRHQGRGRRHRDCLRSVAGRGVRAGAAERLYAGRQGRSRREVHQLSHAHARSRERSTGAHGRESREDGHV